MLQGLVYAVTASVSMVPGKACSAAIAGLPAERAVRAALSLLECCSLMIVTS